MNLLAYFVRKNTYTKDTDLKVEETYKCVEHKCNTDTLKEIKHRVTGLLYMIEDALKEHD